MLLTITCTRPEGADWSATDLGYLLHKNPARAQSFEQSFGTAHIVYPHAEDQRCTAALVLEVDPIRLVRGYSRGAPDFSLGQYVNDRPYAAGSLLSVALGAVFRTALRGRCEQRPEAARTALPLRIELPSVPCAGGPELARRIFMPLGWEVEATPVPLDPAFPDWGDSPYVHLVLTGTVRLAEALSHLYVLLPVLDGAKHYWVAADEVDKLIRAGEGWLGDHPERVWITRRYLARRHSLVRTALARLAEIDDAEPEQLDAVVENADSDVPSPDSAAASDSPAVQSVPSSLDSVPSVVSPGGVDLSQDSVSSVARSVSSSPESAVPSVVAPGDVDLSHDSVSSVARSVSTPRESAAPSVVAPGDVYPSHDSVSKEVPGDGETVEKPDLPAQATPATGTGVASPGADPDEGVRPPSLAVARRTAVLDALRACGARRVLDLGCGEGALLRELLADRTFDEIVGVDVSTRALAIAERRLGLDRLPERVARRVRLFQGSLTYTDARLRGYDAAVLMEVIEHVDPPRLAALEHAVFASATPATVLVTTPNVEANVRYEGLAPGAVRHHDHRFEWTRAQFEQWATGVAGRHGYTVRFVGVGTVDPEHGAPTQMAVFSRSTAASAQVEEGAA